MRVRPVRAGLALLPMLLASACAARATTPPTAPAEPRILEVRQGLASFYGPGFEGKPTASGIPFDKTAMVAAHPSYLRMHLRDGYSWASPMHLSLGAQAAGWEQGIALLGELFGRAMEEGSLRPARPELVAKLVVASHQVFLADWVDGGMKDDPATIVGAILTHFEQSFAARPTSAREENA